ncbi:unnamed protein product, partial [Closterium sp. NIES-54]
VPPATIPRFSTPRPGPSQPAAANDDDKYPRVLTVEQWQQKANEKWLKHFPRLIISETSWGQPCMRCSICMVHGDPSYQYGRDGEGGLDIQRQTMRKHQHSIKHEASLDRQHLRDCKNAAQKSIVDFENGDGEANRLTKLLATVIFICRSDSPIVLFVTLVQFMAEMGTPDMPLKDPGTYYSEYGFAQLVETLVIYLRAQQMKHIRESPYLGIQLDESTDRRRGKHLIVYLSFLRSNTPVTEFFAHLTVEQCDAGSLQAVLLTHLESTGLDLERISGISTDGINWTRAQKEISSFTTIMSTHHCELSFQDGLKQMLSSPDWCTAYPNLVRLWMAVAVLPLSTVECERGFSRQNVIKSWLRGNLNDAKLGDLMTISMLKYEPNWPALVELWRGAKKRHPAKDVVMVHALRPGKRTRKTLAMLALKQAAATAAAAAEAAAREAAAAEEAARLEEELGPWQRRADHGKEHIASDSELDGDDEEYSSHDSDSES